MPNKPDIQWKWVSEGQDKERWCKEITNIFESFPDSPVGKAHEVSSKTSQVLNKVHHLYILSIKAKVKKL